MNENHPVAGLPSALPGRLGKYRVIARIGRGGMAEIYLAVTSGPAGFNKLHVLKHLRRESFDNDDAVRMFAEEARLSALLNHPNVVQAFEVGEDAGAVFIVLEYLEGQSLQSVGGRLQSMVPDQRVRLEIRLRIVADVLNGLHYAHELRDLNGNPLQLVHRDVTPHNIFITYDGGIKLLDFGIAKTAVSATLAGAIKGKLAYLAPEQVADPIVVDRRTDIFQCGLILWEGLLGRRIWGGMTDYQILRRLASHTFPELEPPSDADPELVRICRRAAAARPDDRYETAEAFNHDIEAYMSAHSMRLTAKDVGTQVAAMFAEQRTELRDAIRSRLRQVELEGDGMSAWGDGSSQLLPTFSTDGTRTEHASHPPSAFHANGRRMAMAAVGVAICAGLGAAVVQRLFPASDAATSPGLGGVAAVATPARAARIELSIETTPPGAKLLIDGAPAGTSPTTTQVARDDREHVIRAEAAGYEPATLSVMFDRNAKQVMSLAPLPAGGANVDAAESTPKVVRTIISRARGPVSQPAITKSTGAPPPPAAPTPAKPVGGRGNAPSIDTSDPWQ